MANLPVEQIHEKSEVGAVRELVNNSINSLIREGKPPREAAKQVYDRAEQKWGKKIPRSGV
jgi:hypothetical protein